MFWNLHDAPEFFQGFLHTFLHIIVQKCLDHLLQNFQFITIFKHFFNEFPSFTRTLLGIPGGSPRELANNLLEFNK